METLPRRRPFSTPEMEKTPLGSSGYAMIGALYLSIVALGCAGAGVFLLVNVPFFLSAKRAIGRVVRWEPQRVGNDTITQSCVSWPKTETSTNSPEVRLFRAHANARCCTVVYPAENPQVAMAGGLSCLPGCARLSPSRAPLGSPP